MKGLPYLIWVIYLLILLGLCLTEKCLEYYPGQQELVVNFALATKEQLKEVELITQGFPINRYISDAIKLFGELEDKETFFKGPSNHRINLTHEPISTINITLASPLHSYTCIFRWFNLLVYHLNCSKLKWSTTSTDIRQFMIFVRNLVQEKTRLKVDQPDPSGGTTSTRSIARRAFSNESKFIECVSSLVEG